MELKYEPETTQLWAVCDNDCNGRTATLDVESARRRRSPSPNTTSVPPAWPNLNNEGFAIAPQAECVNGLKPVFYTDDDNTGGHALRTGTINCTPLTAAVDADTCPAVDAHADCGRDALVLRIATPLRSSSSRSSSPSPPGSCARRSRSTSAPT